MIPAYMTQPIRTADEATAFIKALIADGKLFHFEDSPDSIVDGPALNPIFTPEECAVLEERVAEMFDIDGFCPFETALALDPDYNPED